MKQRNIFLSIILTLLTCGIYGLVWLWCLNNELRVVNNKNTNSVTNFLFSILTCGIYFLVWNYKLGEEVEDAGGKNEGTMYLILSLFGLSLIALALAQSQVNRICERNGNF